MYCAVTGMGKCSVIVAFYYVEVWLYCGFCRKKLSVTMNGTANF